MTDTDTSRNKALVLDVVETLCSRRDYAAAKRYCSPDCIQHSAHTAPGRAGLFDLIRTAPANLC